MNQRIRASDADRERVIGRLHDEVGTGRLSLDEFSERCAAVYRARTVGDLQALTSDLPSAQVVARRVGFGLTPVLVAVALLVGTGLLVALGFAAADSMDSMGSMMERMCSGS